MQYLDGFAKSSQGGLLIKKKVNVLLLVETSLPHKLSNSCFRKSSKPHG